MNSGRLVPAFAALFWSKRETALTDYWTRAVIRRLWRSTRQNKCLGKLVTFMKTRFLEKLNESKDTYGLFSEFGYLKISWRKVLAFCFRELSGAKLIQRITWVEASTTQMVENSKACRSSLRALAFHSPFCSG